MRVAFFVLLFANLVFWGWAHWIDTAPAPGFTPGAAIDATAGAGPGAASGADGSSASSAAAGAGTGTAAPGAAALAAHCRSLGPFPDTVSASAAAAAILAARDLRSQPRSVASTGDDGYWVYLPAIKTEAGRLRVLARLKAAGIGDAVALAQTDQPDAVDRISLGLFRDAGYAQRRADAVKRLGLAPVVQPHRTASSQYWLDFRLPAAAADPGLADIGQAQGVLRVADSLRVIDCPAPATAPAHAAAASGGA